MARASPAASSRASRSATLAQLGSITLAGRFIRLEPLTLAHADDLLRAAADEEIWRWYAPEHWGTAVNPEAKYLLLRHAFEAWGAIRVTLKTDARNERSQAAIRKLGARYEGTLRNHRIRRDGTYRDTVVFSIIASEGPGVRAALEDRLASFGP